MEGSDRLSALRIDLVNRLGRERYDLWLGPQTTMEFSANTLRIGCSTSFEVQFLRRRLHPHLVEGGALVAGKQFSVEYFVRPATSAGSNGDPPSQMQQRLFEEDQSTVDRHTSAVSNCSAHSKSKELKAEHTAGRAEKTPQRNKVAPTKPSKSTFSAFVTGPCNELAFRTAKMVASRLGHYGPLLLHGPPGSGKTHLQYSIIQEVRNNNPQIRAVRLTAEQFTSEFLEALNGRTSPSFRHKYRSVDVLLIDDIQFLIGKRATLEELLVTIDSLQERGKQVILACTGTPAELKKVSPELVTKISGGLAIPLELPDYATRLGLVRQFLAQMHPIIGMSIDGEVASMIANQIAGSARQLRGAINRLIVTSEALGKPLTVDLARTVLAEYVQQITPSVRLSDIQQAVCEVFHVEPGSLKSKSKTRSIAEPRMVAMWLACNLTSSALGEISEYFGRRSHSTVISAQRRIDRLVSQGASICVADRTCKVEEAIRKVRAALRIA